MSKSLTEVGKFLSLVLRHKPEAIGLQLDPEGWADIDTLMARADIPLTRELISEVVATSEKKRFAISPDGRSIRANQGHSIAVDLGLVAVEPPEQLFHGTASRFLDSIRAQGLLPQNRQYVHLSADLETAVVVGQRHGKPVVLSLPALEMHRQGHVFSRAENGVWLTGPVPPDWLEGA
ncbi:MAG: RNA 2'-phosphotransferase [Paracoccus sp. (in: a-proteobacteria)]|nr:RNA 2'-phosphotransferase [Paracoccus sp. (in: a-proteobacteria)]